MSSKVEKATERRGECVTRSEKLNRRTMNNSDQRISSHMRNTPLMNSLPSPQCYWASDPDKQEHDITNSSSLTEEHKSP